MPPSDALSGHSLDRGDNLVYRMAATRAQVQGGARAAFGQVREGANMRVRQVRHMDVVADRGPVGGRIIGAVDLDRARVVERRTYRQRDQMRFGIMVFAGISVR